MPPNWIVIHECGLWRWLGVGECNDCPKVIKCWGEETQLPEPSPESLETLKEILGGE